MCRSVDRLIIGMFYSSILVLSAFLKNDYRLLCSLHQADVFLPVVYSVVHSFFLSLAREHCPSLPFFPTSFLWSGSALHHLLVMTLSSLNAISTVMLPKDSSMTDLAKLRFASNFSISVQSQSLLLKSGQ